MTNIYLQHLSNAACTIMKFLVNENVVATLTISLSAGSAD